MVSQHKRKRPPKWCENVRLTTSGTLGSVPYPPQEAARKPAAQGAKDNDPSPGSAPGAEQTGKRGQVQWSGGVGWEATAAGLSHDSCHGRFLEASTGYKINSALGFRPERTGWSWQWDNTTKGAARTSGGEMSCVCMCVCGHEHRHEPWSLVRWLVKWDCPLPGWEDQDDRATLGQSQQETVSDG